MSEQTQVIQYQPEGTCSKFMQVAIKDNKVVDVEVIGGCSGNLQGIVSLVRGMDIDEVISKLQGIKCGPKPTSCPDQLAQCLVQYKSQVSISVK